MTEDLEPAAEEGTVLSTEEAEGGGRHEPQPVDDPARRPWRGWRLVAEFVVVFLGVYSAFLLDGLRDRQRDDKRRLQILGTLEQDFREGAEVLQQAIDGQQALLGQPVLDPLEKGEMPTLLPIPVSGAFEGDSWAGMLSAGGVDVLEISLIRDVDKSLGMMAALADLGREYNAYVRDVLVPNLGKGPEEFYDLGTGALRSKYVWYYIMLRNYSSILERLQQHFLQLEQQVRSALDGG